MKPIKRAVAILGGNARLAKRVGITAALVSQWVNETRPVAAHHCISIEDATNGEVTRYDLRPDVFGKAPQERAA